MRTLFLAVMIALLPLRGWVGDVMAVEIVHTRGMGAATAVDPAMPHADMQHAHMMHGDADRQAQHGQGQAPHAGCPDHTVSSPDSQAQPNGADCSSCTVCQICHSVALTPNLPPLVSSTLPASRPDSAAPQFASAECAENFKPPIF